MLSGYGAQIRGMLPNTSEPYGSRRGSRGCTWALSLATEEGCGHSLLALASRWHQCLKTGKPCGLSFQGRPRCRRIPSQRHWMMWTKMHGEPVESVLCKFSLSGWSAGSQGETRFLIHFGHISHCVLGKVFKHSDSESTWWTSSHSCLCHFLVLPPLANYLNSLSLNFLICNKGIVFYTCGRIK